MISLGFVLGIIALLFLSVFPAWSFRIWAYPFEGVARRRRYWFGLPVSSWWYEIGSAETGFEHRPVTVMVESRDDGGGVAAFGCLLLLAGPLGILIGMLLPTKPPDLKAQQMYVLASRRLGVGAEVVALFFREEDARFAAQAMRAVLEEIATKDLH